MTDYRGIQEKFHQLAESLKSAVQVIQELEQDFESAGTEDGTSPQPGPEVGWPHNAQAAPPGTPPGSMPPPWYTHPSYAAMMSNLMQMMTQLHPETNGASDPAVPVPMPVWGFGMPGWGWPGAPWPPFWMGWGGANPSAESAPPPAPTFPGSWTWSWEPRQTPSGPRHVHAGPEGDTTRRESDRNG